LLRAVARVAACSDGHESIACVTMTLLFSCRAAADNPAGKAVTGFFSEHINLAVVLLLAILH
jgi:hypothetical protein